MAVPNKGWGLVGCSKEEQVQGRGQGRVGLAVGQGARASVAGGVVFVVSDFLLKDALWGGGVPTGAGLVDRGGRPRALIPGEGSGKALGTHPPELAWWTGGQGGGARARGGVQGLRFRGGGQGRVGLAVGGGARASVAG